MSPALVWLPFEMGYAVKENPYTGELLTVPAMRLVLAYRDHYGQVIGLREAQLVFVPEGG